jgi:hypothetical protein
MGSKIIGISVFVFGAVVFVFGATAQEISEETPTSLWDFRIVQYVSAQGTHPIQVMGYDNNGDVLMACRSGKTKQQLKELGVSVSDSQLLLLELYDLLSIEDGILKTSFPILGPDQTRRIRGLARETAADLISHVQADVSELLGLLTENGRERNAYSILFAYVFDGMFWQELGAKGLVQPKKIDVDHPFWAGEVYAFYPGRSFSCGTNTFSEGPIALSINWSRAANPLLSPLYPEIRKLDNAVFRDFIEKGYVEDKAIKEALKPFGIFNEAGHLMIPVIEEKENNTLYQISRKISKRSIEHTLSLVSFEELKQDLGLRDVQQAIIIFYHELIWDLMDAVEARGLARKPIAFTNPEEATAKNVADLMFVIRSEE